MKVYLILLIPFFSCDSQVAKNNVIIENNISKTTIDQLNGFWVSEEDSLYRISVTNNTWSNLYHNQLFNKYDVYDIDLKNKLPKYVDESVTAEYLILSNKIDTLEYEIIGLSDSLLSVMFYPRMNRLIYRRVK